MKLFLTIIAVLAAFASSWAVDIHSTPEGGNWTNSSTWQGGIVPGQADNVFLHGPVSVNANLNCHNLTVYSGARLYPSVNMISLTVGGNVFNYGTVDNYPGWYNLKLNCAGNIVSSSQFIPYQLIMSGTGNQSINASGNFKPANFTKTSNLGTVTPLTDLNLENCQINFNGGTLNLGGGRQLAINNGTITNMTIQGTNGGSLNLTGSVNLSNTTADEINIQGSCNIGSGVSIGTLHNHAVLQNNYASHYTLSVTDRLNNYGTLRNYPGYNSLTINLAGDLYNYGTLSNKTIHLSSDGVQILWQDNESPDITCQFFTAQEAAMPIQLMSDIRFTGCTVDLGGRTLRLFTSTASYILSVTGYQLKNAVIQGNSTSTLNFAGGCILSNLEVDEAKFTGEANCSSGVVVGIMHNHAVLQNNYASHYTLNVTNRLNNYGTLQNYSGYNSLTLDLAGDLYNYGTLSNKTIHLSSDGVQILWQDNESPDITCRFFTAQEAAMPIQLMSDIRFTGCTVDLGGRTLCLFTSTASYILSVTGYQLKNAVIQGNSTSTLNFANGCQLLDLEVDEAKFTGEANCLGGVVVGIMHNHAVLQNDSASHYTLNVTNRLNNYGTLQNYPGYNSLTLDLAGDLYNYGTLSNKTINLSGDRRQILWQSANAPAITCQNFTAQVTDTPIQLMSNLRFNGCTVDLGGRTLRLLTSIASYTLSVTGSQLKNAVIQGNSTSTLNFAGGCRLSNLVVDEAKFTGEANCLGGVVVGIMHNYAVLQNDSSSHYTLNVTNRLNNYGTLRNYPGWNNLQIYLQGDLHNHGTMSNQRTYINGNVDQNLKLYPGCTVTSQGGFVLVSEIGAGQWYFNGHAQTNEYLEQYNADPFVDGVWQAYNGSAWSRHIYINEGLAPPVNLILTVGPNNALTLQWNQVPNATSYKVYYATVPEGPWTAFPGSVIDNDTEDGIVTYPLGQSQQHMFYRVSSIK